MTYFFDTIENLYRSPYGDLDFVGGVDPDVRKSSLKMSKTNLAMEMNQLRLQLELLQEKLWAQRSQGLIVVLQGLDTAGKDGTIRRVFEGINPQGVKVHSLKYPTPIEAGHDFLWRIHAITPQMGEISIFNRSHYEDLIVPKTLKTLDESTVERRVRQVMEFERYLYDNNIYMIKIFLKISIDTQAKRLTERLDDPNKHWKFSQFDVATRKKFHDFENSYQQIVAQTSFDFASWYVVPANHKKYRDYVVLSIIAHTLRQMKPEIPKIKIRDIEALKKKILSVQ